MVFYQGGSIVLAWGTPYGFIGEESDNMPGWSMRMAAERRMKENPFWSTQDWQTGSGGSYFGWRLSHAKGVSEETCGRGH